MKIIHLSPATDEILGYNFASTEKQIFSYRGFQLVAEEALKIGEVAVLLGRKPDTIRKWEKKGWVPEQRSWDIGREGRKKVVRFYSHSDVEDIRELVSSLHRGRPRKDKRITTSIPSKANLKTILRERVKRINVKGSS